MGVYTCIRTTPIKMEIEYSHLPKMFLSDPLQLISLITLPAPDNHLSNYSHYRLVLPVLGFHINGIMQYVLLCVCSFIIMSMRFIHVVHALFFDEQYSIVWLFHCLIHSMMDILVVSFFGCNEECCEH